MSGDTVFWKNNERAYELFQDLLACSERRAYDDHFLVQLAAYREEDTNAAYADIFAAEYLLATGDAASAIVCGERAFRIRPVEPRVWDVLARAHAAGMQMHSSCRAIR